jgi:hypothetical protein
VTFASVFRVELLGYGLGDPGFKSRERKGIYLFCRTFRTSLGPTQTPIQYVARLFTQGVNSRIVKLITHLPLVPRWRMGGTVDKSTFTFLRHVG